MLGETIRGKVVRWTKSTSRARTEREMCCVMIDLQTVSFTGLRAHLEKDHTRCGCTTLSPFEQCLVWQMAFPLGSLAASDSLNPERGIQECGTLMIISHIASQKAKENTHQDAIQCGNYEDFQSSFSAFLCVLLVWCYMGLRAHGGHGLWGTSAPCYVGKVLSRKAAAIEMSHSKCHLKSHCWALWKNKSSWWEERTLSGKDLNKSTKI